MEQTGTRTSAPKWKAPKSAWLLFITFMPVAIQRPVANHKALSYSSIESFRK